MYKSWKKVYGNKLLSKVRKQLNLSTEEFKDLVKCPLTKEMLEEIYRDIEQQDV